MENRKNNITMIAAVGRNNEIGKNNKLIWHISEDLKYFKEQTMNKPIVMGLKTFKSLPNLLSGREHLVLTHQQMYIPNVTVFTNKEDILKYAKNLEKEVMVIGGSSIYYQFMDYADKILLTKIDREDKDADSYFPLIDEKEWDIRKIADLEENNIKYKRLEYKRKV